MNVWGLGGSKRLLPYEVVVSQKQYYLIENIRRTYEVQRMFFYSKEIIVNKKIFTMCILYFLTIK